MNAQLKNVLLVIGLLISACGPLESESTLVVAPEPIVEVTEDPAVIPAESAAEEPALPPISSYIGMVYPPLPLRFVEGFGLLIQDKDGYSLSLISDGGRRMLWLEKVSRYEADGNVIWEVMDVLDFSGLEPGLTLLPDGCFLNGSSDSEILVASKNEVIVLAWRANTTLDKFEIIPADGIKCNSDKAFRLG